MILYGRPVGRAYFDRLKARRDRLPRAPRLVIISDGHPDSEYYKHSLLKLARKMEVEIVSSVEEGDGVVQLGEPQIRDLPPEKDIEGISEYHIGRIAYDDALYVPPTPMAAILLLEYYREEIGCDLSGADAVIVGRSVRVGKPLAFMLINRDSTVSILHRKTKDVVEYTRRADVVFLSAGVGEYFGREYFTPESIVVDISTVPRDGRWVGDARFEELKDYVKAITPVPGGVGKITPLVLFDNLFKAVEIRYGLYDRGKAHTTRGESTTSPQP